MENQNIAMYKSLNLTVQPQTIRKRSTGEQRTRLLDMVESSFHFVSGHHATARSDSKKKTWARIATELNTLGPPKSPLEWRRCLQDMKSNAKNKLEKANREGGMALQTDLDQRVLALCDNAMLKPFEVKFIAAECIEGFQKVPEPHDTVVAYRCARSERVAIRKPVSEIQQKKLLDMVERNFDFIAGRHCVSRTSLSKEELWVHIANELNSTEGPSKSASNWKKCFHDLHFKAKERLRQKNAIGESVELSEIDQRMLALCNVLKQEQPVGKDESDQSITGIPMKFEFIAAQENTSMDSDNTQFRNRSTELQRNKLMDMVERNFDFIPGRHGRVRSSRTKQELWKSISIELNALGPPKTQLEWRTCFQDIKVKAKQKFRTLETCDNTDIQLSDQDKRALVMCGMLPSIKRCDQVVDSHEPRARQTISPNVKKPVETVPSIKEVRSDVNINEPKVHVCSVCSMQFALSSALLVHKLNTHSPLTIAKILTDLLTDERLCSSDDEYDYTFLFSTTYHRSPKAIVKNEPSLLEDKNPSYPSILKIDMSDDQSDSSDDWPQWQQNEPPPAQIIEVKCPKCHSKFRSNAHMGAHYRKEHPRSAIATEAPMINIVGTSSKTKSYVCYVCNEDFTNISGCFDHLTYKHKNVIARIDAGLDEFYCCPICQKINMPFVSFQTHVHCHEASNPQCLCYVCGKYLRGWGIFEVHMRKHTGERPHICDLCGKTYMSIQGIRDHMGTHADQKPFACTVDGCDLRFAFRSGLRQHCIVNHDSEKRHACNFCGRKYYLQSRLNIHKTVHTGKKPYQCEVCRKPFRLMDSLKRHMMIHTGKRPYKCSACDKGFTCNAKLNAHLQRLTPCAPPKEVNKLKSKR